MMKEEKQQRPKDKDKTDVFFVLASQGGDFPEAARTARKLSVGGLAERGADLNNFFLKLSLDGIQHPNNFFDHNKGGKTKETNVKKKMRKITGKWREGKKRIIHRKRG
jgi:hypothetical protein